MINTKVMAFLKKKQIKLDGKVVAVGVSGGPDSMALLHFLYTLQKSASFQLIAVCVDHMFRKEQSYEEALFVLEFCASRGIICEMKQIDVPTYMKEQQLSTQVAARECRYAFYEEVMQKYQVDYLALAHHGDDQVESIIMRLTRGATTKARAGMPFERPFSTGEIIRPFLCLTKDEILNYLEMNKIEYRLDPSNDKDDYMRNRIRHHVLPVLKEENPLVHQHFQRFSEEVLEDEAWMMSVAQDKLNKYVTYKDNGEIHFSIKEIQVLPMPLQRRMIQLILNYLYTNRTVSLSFIHIDKILSVVYSEQSSTEINLPDNLKVIRAYDNCKFSFLSDTTENYCIQLDNTGKFILPTKEVLQVDYVEQKNDKISEWEFFLPIKDETFPLFIRTYQEGDRIALPNMSGTKKINRLFIDEKIPLAQRHTWPLLVNNNNEVLWVIGLRKSVHVKSSFQSKGYIQFIFNKA